MLPLSCQFSFFFLVLLPPDNTIITELQDANTFNTLLQLLDFANLDGFFDDPTDGPFTLFAPTDAAFADLLADLDVTLEEVLADPVALANILQYHVVDGLFGSGDLANLDSIETLQGESIEIDGTTLKSNTEITLADILASNGVIHVIDKVLIPGGDGNDATLPPDDVDDPDVNDPDIDDPDGGTGTNGTDATLDPIVDGVDQDGGTGTNNTDATLDPIDGGTDANNTDTNVDIVDDGTNSTNTTDDGVDTIDDIRGGGGGTNVLPRAVDQETTVPIDV